MLWTGLDLGSTGGTFHELPPLKVVNLGSFPDKSKESPRICSPGAGVTWDFLSNPVTVKAFYALFGWRDF